MTIKTVECCMCGADIEYEEFKQVPGYCGDICCKQDIEKQISERGYFVPYIPIQISKIIFKEDNKDSKYCPKCAFPVGEDLKSVPYYISGQKCPNCGFLEDKP